MSVSLQKKKQQENKTPGADTNPVQLTEVPSQEDFQKLVAKRYKQKKGRKQKKQSVDAYFPPALVERARKRESDVIANIFHDKTGLLPTSTFDCPPDFTNPEGTKWWLNNFVSEWAWKKNLQGVSLPNFGVWQVETKTGERSILIVDHETNNILREYRTIEDTAYGIDMFKVVKHFDSK